ncbi:hypothetical protein M2272_005590 [Mycobacterium frederiksbergense]|uniref:PE domain-containing protein n=1 Tax=Mycolicibacterium frederiksbergense TaxID=117567 RepID=A0ABT6L7J4_9MYCO|nr:hypothetical protein [Mycolicibacterium frederiksbergense]
MPNSVAYETDGASGVNVLSAPVTNAAGGTHVAIVAELSLIGGHIGMCS